MFNIVIIDDEYYFRSSLKNSVNWGNYQLNFVGEANNGIAGYELILEKKPDIAIVDINMPQLNGLNMISKIRALDINCEFILLTGYGEFEYAQTAINLGISSYLLKPIEKDKLDISLKKVINKLNKNKTINNTLKDLQKKSIRHTINSILLRSTFATIKLSEKEIIEQISCLYDNPALIFSYYRFILININDGYTNYEQELYNSVLSLIDQYKFIIYSNNVGDLFILKYHETNQIVSSFFDALEGILNNMEITYSIGISDAHYSLKELKTAYYEANYHINNSNKNEINFELTTDDEVILHSDEMAEKLSFAIISKNEAKIIEYINELFDTVKNYSYNIIILNIMHLIAVTISTIKKNNAEYKVNSTNLNYLNNLNNLDEMKNWLLKFLFNNINKIEKHDKLNNTSAEIEKYILEHIYEETLSVADIAEQLYMSYSYLCSCFKKDKNITINEFITTTRIEKAKECFRNGATNISIVAQMLGYSSNSYFSKVFKKKVGISPSDFIQTCL